ncbi:hypothetical protein [Marinoscillum furvescens]|uniref:Uncharacterized protein n=1 Tax=Marinoscillum furvescens DSM 4134 TaxID=1122208 RepID=A0A3D9L5F1_MARFU|nr:hypothetical protein [Marinoscillum furvescens]REE01265.1 hypothetical protein C7460_104285 [Marinoscillum furvescens DSM 4134]
MKTSSRPLIPFLLVIALWCPQGLDAKGGVDDTFMELSQRLEEAIEVRNFQEARNAIEQLLPLMKDVLKSDKKTLAELKKSDDPEANPEEFEEDMKRKAELYNSLKKLVNISPAALRVKAELIKKEVKEFIELS